MWGSHQFVFRFHVSAWALKTYKQSNRRKRLIENSKSYQNSLHKQKQIITLHRYLLKVKTYLTCRYHCQRICVSVNWSFSGKFDITMHNICSCWNTYSVYSVSNMSISGNDMLEHFCLSWRNYYFKGNYIPWQHVALCSYIACSSQ